MWWCWQTVWLNIDTKHWTVIQIPCMPLSPNQRERYAEVLEFKSRIVSIFCVWVTFSLFHIEGMLSGGVISCGSFNHCYMPVWSLYYHYLLLLKAERNYFYRPMLDMLICIAFFHRRKKKRKASWIFSPIRIVSICLLVCQEISLWLQTVLLFCKDLTLPFLCIFFFHTTTILLPECVRTRL